MYFIKSNRIWMEDHFWKDDEDFWFCKETGAPMQVAECRVTILHPDFEKQLGGTGETKDITHVACLECFPESKPPVSGLQVREEELTSVG